MVRLRRRRRRACPGHDIEEVSMPPRAAKKTATEAVTEMSAPETEEEGHGLGTGQADVAQLPRAGGGADRGGRMARYGSLETRMIVATGCLKRIDGVVGAVEDFERKVDLLANLGRRDFVFVYARRNVTAAIRGKLECLERERGAELKAINSLNEVKFLWTGAEAARRARWRWIRRLAAGFLVLAAALYIYRNGGGPRWIITIAKPVLPDQVAMDPDQDGVTATYMPSRSATLYILPFDFRCLSAVSVSMARPPLRRNTVGPKSTPPRPFDCVFSNT